MLHFHSRHADKNNILRSVPKCTIMQIVYSDFINRIFVYIQISKGKLNKLKEYAVLTAYCAPNATIIIEVSKCYSQINFN